MIQKVKIRPWIALLLVTGEGFKFKTMHLFLFIRIYSVKAEQPLSHGVTKKEKQKI